MHDNTQTQAQPKNNMTRRLPRHSQRLSPQKRGRIQRSPWRHTTQQLPNNSVRSSLDSVRFKTMNQQNKTRCKCAVKLLHFKLSRRANANQALSFPKHYQLWFFSKNSWRYDKTQESGVGRLLIYQPLAGFLLTELNAVVGSKDLVKFKLQWVFYTALVNMI
jgi:hypothetical protein